MYQSQVRLYLGVLFVSAMVIAPPVVAEDDWHFEKREGGIEVFTRAVAGSEIREFKGIGEVESGVERILEVLEDADGYEQWFPNCVASKALPEGEGASYRYSVSGTPWPISDRDMILRVETNRDEASGKVVMDVEAAPDLYPIQKDLVRVQEASGRWTLERIDAERTRVTFMMHLEPGGGLPDWLINARVVGTPLATLTNLQNFLGVAPTKSETEL